MIRQRCYIKGRSLRCSRSTRTDTMQVTAILLLLLVSNVLAKIGDTTTEKLPETKPDVNLSTTIAPPTAAPTTAPTTVVPTTAAQTALPTTTPRTPLNSSFNVTRLGDRYYFAPNNQKATVLDARQFCRSFGMDLASVETKEENNLIYSYLDDIGLAPHFVSISAHKIGRGNHIWINGATFDFNDWASGQPAYTSRNCVIMWSRKWYDIPCEDYTAYFICEQAP